MYLINNYIFRQWFSCFIYVLGFLAVLFVCQGIYNFLLDLLRAGESLASIVQYFVIELFVLLPILLPVSFFLSILITFLGLQRSGQITALKSFGLSLFQISTSLWIVAVVLSLFILFISSSLIPKLVERNFEYTEKINLQNNQNEITDISETLTFENFNSRRLWFIEDFNYSNNSGGYSVLHQMDDSGNEVSRIISEKSVFDSDLETWLFSNGTELFFDSVTGDPLRSVRFENKQFLGLEETPNDFLLFNKKFSELSLNQLRRLLDLVPHGIKMREYILIEFNAMLVAPFYSVILVALSIPFAARANVRTGLLIEVFRSISAVLLFFLTIALFKNFGLNLYMSPMFIVLIPFLIFSAYGIRLFWRQ